MKEFGYRKVGAVELTMEGEAAPQQSPPEEFFDFRNLRPHNVSSVTAPPAVEVWGAGKLIGLWLHERESLFLSDWSYDMECVRWGVYFFPQLVQKLGIKPLRRRRRPRILATEVTVGADLEFELLVIEDPFCRAGGGQVKLRPKPGSPSEVVRSLRDLIKDFAEEYEEYDLSPQGDTYPCEGHIHLGGLPPLSTPPRRLLEILDDFLGRPSLPLSGKAHGSYKELSAWEAKPNGLEYRSLPAAVFANPKITKITLKLARNLAWAYLQKSVLEYNDPPTAEDYRRLGKLTAREVEYFLAFLRNPERRPIRAAWGA
ncbi:MAG: hypothetical protein ABC596_05965 [Candidatus Methanosuratincola petrocarbonis]